MNSLMWDTLCILQCSSNFRLERLFSGESDAFAAETPTIQLQAEAE